MHDERLERVMRATGLRRSQVYRRLMERLPVRTPQRQLVPMRFNAVQERLWEVVAPALDAAQPLHVIVLKARRQGVSTFVEGLLTTLCVLQDYTQALVVAHLQASAQRIFAISETMVRQSPLQAIVQIRGQTLRCRQSLLTMATAGTPEASRSADLTCLHASEVAFWRYPEALLALRQCLPQDERVFCVEVAESTANGMVDEGELFYREWQAACAGTSGFVPIFLPWHTFPAYTSPVTTPLDDLDPEEEILRRDLGLTWGQLRWRRRVIRERCQDDVDKFNQEYPATPEMAFIVSGLPFFRAADLLWLEEWIEPGRRGRLIERQGRVRFVDDPRGPVRVFRPPWPGREYVIGADSAMGLLDVGAREYSRSAAEVLDMATLEQVAEYEATCPPHQFARDLALLGRAYNEALVAPEVQASGGGGGREIIVYLRDQYQYPHLHRWLAPDRIRQGTPVLYGWETNSRTRPRMLARLREVILERSIRLHSRALVTQLRSFGESDAGKLEALAGHDDLLFALGIALMSRSENYVARSAGGTDPHGPLPWQTLGLAQQDDPVDRERQIWEEMAATWEGPLVAQPGDLLAW